MITEMSNEWNLFLINNQDFNIYIHILKTTNNTIIITIIIIIITTII